MSEPMASTPQVNMESPDLSRGRWRSFARLLIGNDPPKLLLTVIFVLSLCETGAGLVVPWMTKNLVDVLSTSTLQKSTIFLLIGAFVLQALSAAFSYYLLSFLGQRVVADLRKRLWSQMLALPVSYFDRNRTGETVSRITNDTLTIKELITNHLVSFFSSVISIIGSIAILLYLDWRMTLVMLASLPIVFFVLRPLGQQMYKISRSTQDEMASFSGLLTQVLSEVRLVKAFTAESIERDNGEKGIGHLFRFGMKEARIQAILAPLMGLVLMAMLVTIIGYGGVRVASGHLTAGTLVAFLLYLFRILMPLTQLAQFFTALQKAFGASDRLQAILAEKTEVSSGTLTVEETHRPIVLEDVRFSYATGDQVLHGVDLTIPPGRVTAIVGPSGSGKTTLFSLLERFYEPTAGEVRFGETALREFDLEEWRRQLSYVSQESPVMAGTIRENICYGLTRTVPDDELVQAAEMAYAHSFIVELPNGYDTEVGERGVKLSGGQRQRIAIARALLRNPHVLMLDEATSALDSTSERVVQEALSRLMEGRTTLVIAHRLSTVVGADQIVVLEQGRVTGVGRHEELMEQHALYRELAVQQFGAGEEAE
jgi:ATP-binding cassette, subfamily B, bacterial AbcA/BmrA